MQKHTTTMLCYVAMVVGSFFIALSFNIFLLPNKIASGGVSGVSIILDTLLQWDPAYTQWGLNLPIFFIGVFILGKSFGLKTLVGTLVLPLFVLLTQGISSPTHDPLLAAIFGGLGIGLGLGLVFRGFGSTGGTDTVAQILHRWSGLRLGICVAMIDGTIILAAGFTISMENALYALIALFTTSRTIDAIQARGKTTKSAYIISQDTQRLTRVILAQLKCDLTQVQALGAYSSKEDRILLVIIEQRKISQLKKIVQQTDGQAFVIITNTAEVLGERSSQAEGDSFLQDKFS